MKNKYIFVAVLLLVLMAAGIGLTELYVTCERGGMGKEADTFHIVTSFYPMYIAAENVIGSSHGVILENLSEPQTGCLHDYQLTTEDMRKLSTADAFIVNGGGIENFLSEVAGRYPDLQIIDASERIELLEDNAHAWMSIPDYMIQVQTITDGLAELDGGHRVDYESNCRTYLAQLEKLCLQQETVRDMLLDTEQDAADTMQTAASRKVVIFHEAFAYTARDCGLTVAGSMDLDEERQVSAGEVADIVRLIREQDVSFILAEELYGKQMCQTIQEETQVQVLYLDTCVRGDSDKDSYLRTMQENIRLLQRILNDAGTIAE